MSVAVVAVANEKAEKSRSLLISVCKYHNENDTKVKVYCDKMIHQHCIYITSKIDLVKYQCENSVARKHRIQ